MRQDEALQEALANDDAFRFRNICHTRMDASGQPPAALLPVGRAARNWTWMHAAAAQGA